MVAAGEVILASHLAALHAAWPTYTPVWGATGTAPTVGNGTLLGNYIHLSNRFILFRIVLTLGSTSTVGTGTYTLTLPVTATQPVNSVIAAGAHFFDTSASGYYHHTPYIAATGAGDTIALSATNQRWTATLPVVPANGDVISVSGIYEGDGSA